MQRTYDRRTQKHGIVMAASAFAALALMPVAVGAMSLGLMAPKSTPHDTTQAIQLAAGKLEPQHAARRAVIDRCRSLPGKQTGICMKSQMRRLRTWQDEASDNFQDCLDNGYSSEECNAERHQYWLNKASSL